MKKTILSLVFALTCLVCNAQLYKSIVYYDKFDDIVKTEQRKTLVQKTDTTFVIEEKGKLPVVYYILNPVAEGTKGTKEEPANLVANVYGYQETWCIVRYDKLKEYRDAYYNYYFVDDSEANKNKLISYWLFAVHRTITTHFSATYLDELFWIQDEDSDGKLGKDVNRIIYKKD